MDLMLDVVLVLIIPFCPCFGDDVSKACFGSIGFPCVKHNLRCNTGRIAIQEAFYMTKSECPATGIQPCSTINISSISLTGEKHNYDDKLLNSLCQDCSTQSSCRFPVRKTASYGFSAIKYKCVKGTAKLDIVCNKSLKSSEVDTAQTTSPISSNNTGDKEQQGTGTGTVVGIVIPICIIIAGVVTAVILFRRRKLARKGENGNIAKPELKLQEEHSGEKKSSTDYDYATTNEYFDLVPKVHIMQTPPKGSSGYDYAKCGDQKASHDHSSRNTQTRDSDYDHIGRQPARANGHYDTTLSVADTLKEGNSKQEVYSYNHLNENVSSNADVDSTYNTTASTRLKMDASSNGMEDDYGYNHMGAEPKKNLPQNEYDTTASAIRDVSRMDGDMEDSTYDHAHLITSDCSPSGMTNVGFQESDYDHASPLSMVNKDEYKYNASPDGNTQEDGGTDVYTLAREAEANPSQLAK